MIVLDGSAAADAVTDVAVAHALVCRVSRGELGPVLRVHRPTQRVVAFGRADVRRPGFDSAAAAARRHGFEPVVRAPGGRAVAYTPAALVLDLARPDLRPNAAMLERFVELGGLLAGVLRGLGVNAQVGEVTGEYCPGAYSVNARGTTKLVGIAQRVVRDAWLLSAVLQIGDAAQVRPVLTEVYACLELPFDAGSVGSVRDELPGLDADTVAAAVVDAVLAAAEEAGASIEHRPLDPVTLALATELRIEHQVGPR